MNPTIHIGKRIFDSYTVFTNFGTLAGLFIMLVVINQYCKKEKYAFKLVIITFLMMVLSSPFASFIKELYLQNKDEATHFLGRVLFAVTLMPLVFKFVWKEKDELLQAKNSIAVYFGIQHFFNRLACYLNGCCNGIEIGHTGIVYPSQITEMTGVAILLIITKINIKKNKCFYYGFSIGYAILIFFSEFGIEFTKTDETLSMPITGVQTAALLLIVLSIIYAVLEKKIKSKKLKIKC